MTDDTKRLIFQTVGKFVVIVATTLMAFKGIAGVKESGGFLTVLWEPIMAGVAATAALWGVEQLGPVGTVEKKAEEKRVLESARRSELPKKASK